MPSTEVSFAQSNNELRDANGKVVGLTDRVYTPSNSTITFDDVLLKGDLSGTLEYNGVKLHIVKINSIIGLEVTLTGARGPVWKGVECEVLH